MSHLSLLLLIRQPNFRRYTGALSFHVPPRAALSAVSFNATHSSISLRVYYATASAILEKAFDASGSWYDGNFKQDTIPGSDSAVIDWGSGSSLEIRIYFQNGTAVTGVSEWAYTRGGWTKGVNAIPPA